MNSINQNLFVQGMAQSIAGVTQNNNYQILNVNQPIMGAN